MKIRTIKYIVKEGFANTYKNILMSLASVSMVIASLLIFGIFLMLIINFSYNMNRLKAQVEIVVFLENNASQFETDDVEMKIKNDERVLTYVKITKEQAYAQLVTQYLDDSDLLVGLTPDFLSDSFRIHLKNVEDSEAFTEEIRKMQGVEDVNYPYESLKKLSTFLNWINIGSMVVLALLLVISVSIIANTIKLTVYARRKEIEIMKYIGASDWFIRWPFIIEGIIIGFIGAIVSFILTSYLYNSVESYVNASTLEYGINDLVKLVPLGSVGGQIFVIYAIIGVVMGSVGSIISVRKHLNV
ncbi:MAG: ABC transporter permease [Clostridiaceae bacterium]|nr:ABC transporter permease [Clostridiaceae bacterium]